jgi:putative membrane protein
VALKRNLQGVSAVITGSKNTNELAEDRTDLAFQRTLMAADRTLMAWVRTALSMISFGFTIYKLLQGFQEGGNLIGQRYDPRNAGLFLVGLGTLSMALGTIEYWYSMKDLSKMHRIKVWQRPTLIMALTISVVGILTFFSITLKAI